MFTDAVITVPAALETLRARLSGELSLPGEPGFDRAMAWNVAVPTTACAVVAAADARDVAETVRHAGEHGLRVAVRATGHGAVATDAADVVLVHTAGLDECTVDPARRTARVGAGCTWQRVLDAATPHGLAPLVGSSPGVGVVGFLTGGGIGPLVRTHGLSADHVRAFEVVTGDGELRRVGPGDELFRALRGGKASVGIVTAVELDLLPIATVHGGALYFDGADAATVAHAWARWCDTLPEHANTSLALLQLPPLPDVPPPLAGRFTVAVRYTSVADATTAAAELAPMRAVATPLIDTVADMPYAAIGAVHADPVDPMPTHESSSLLRALPVDAVEALLAAAGPASRSPQVIVELRLMGGALSRTPTHPSAFCHRDAAFSVLTIGVLAPEIAEIVPGHADGVQAALAPWATGGLMPNFGPSTDPDVNARRYDAETRALLDTLAERHDPRGVLAVGQVVRG